MIDEQLQEYEEKPHDYWLSYSDMMACLIMMFVLLLMVLVYIYTDSLKSATITKEKIVGELKKSEQRINEVVGIRRKIIEDLKKQFSNSDLKIRIDPQTGAIAFSSGILFDFNCYEISKNGKASLKKFIPEYMAVLLSHSNRNNISQIIVEGHTDNVGEYLNNLELSQKRAFAVTTYILGDEFPNFKSKEELKNYITSNGRSFSQLIYSGGKVDCDASRRVEFKFRLKEDEMIKEMESILKGTSSEGK